MLPWDVELAGRLDRVSITSELLRGNVLGDPHERPLWVYLPPGYDDEPATRYPTVYVLQGYTGHVAMWANRQPFRQPFVETADAVFASGEAPGCVVVYVDAWTAYGGSQFVDSPGTGAYHSYLCDEVVPWVDAHYRTLPDRESRAVTGKSSGGFGAMITPMLRPDLFAALATHAGDTLYELSYVPEFGKAVRALRDYDGDIFAWWDGFRSRTSFTKQEDDILLILLGCTACFSARPDGTPELPFDPRTGVLRTEVWQRWLDWDPVRMVQRYADEMRSMRAVWIDAGTRDEWFLDLGAEAFRDELAKVGVTEQVHFSCSRAHTAGWTTGTRWRWPGSPTGSSGRGGPLKAPTRTAGIQLDVARAASLDGAEVLRLLDGTEDGLTAAEVAGRQARFGPNAVVSHRARWWPVLWHQVRSPLLGLLLAAAAVSAFVGEGTDAVIIAVIVTASVGLGFVNEYRADKAAEALHSQVRHHVTVLREGRPQVVDVTVLVPGDVVELRLGDVVPADVRLLDVTDLECEESILTGEAEPTEKTTAAVPAGSPLAELTGCALMGTVVHAGRGRGVVVATGTATEFGAIAAGLGSSPGDTAFQIGLRQFSMLLVYVAGILSTFIFVANIWLGRSLIDALLFSLAIAVGITPQLLPAVVSTSLAAGSHELLRHKVLVKRLVCIEDLGDVDVLFTDKTGTLTQGHIELMRADPVGTSTSDEVLRYGLACTETVGDGAGPVAGNSLDTALWDSPATAALRNGLGGTGLAARQVGVLPFDHVRRMVSVVLRDGDSLLLVVKGAPESVLDRCRAVPEPARAALAVEFAAGNRVVAVAARPVTEARPPTAQDERDLELLGFLVFLDPPKPEAAQALGRLASLGVRVTVVTGDNAEVAAKVCHDLGLAEGRTLTGADVDALDDEQLTDAVEDAVVLARMSPEQKARVVRCRRLRGGGGVAFLGDGVNDALALHAADVGISVDSATDVAKDAADVILLEKNLDVLADGVSEGRRIFANTIKYVLMGTSSNFGNMFSAAGASLFLSFLPMLPSQVLLNNLLYDTSQLTIPTDNVDAEQLRRPSHWDIGFIRRFMLTFGPLSSAFDFLTFAIMLNVFHSGPEQFRTGWFVESLATQTLIVFAIRTRRVPFFRSRPSLPLTLSTLTVVAVGAVLPATALGPPLGFVPLPAGFFSVLVGLVVGYLVLVEVGKTFFYRALGPRSPEPRPYDHRRHIRRRAARFGHRSVHTVPVRPQPAG